MAQKVKLDTLDIDQLNLYKDKAVTMRNTGMILTLSGVGVAVTSFTIGVSIILNCNFWDCPSAAIAVTGWACMAGMATTVVGIPLWAIGGSRKAKAELALQKFNIAPKNSMAVGLGITLRF